MSDDKKNKQPKGAAPGDQAPPILSAQAYTPQVKSTTQFPVPDLYFKVFDSEADEPEAKIRRDVNKLYERWQAKYGRRWPDNGMNTEDLVWLAEEAYKPQDGVPAPAPGDLRAAATAVEEPRYPGEFIAEPEASKPATGGAAGGKGSKGGAAAGDKGTKGSGKAKGTQRPLSNFEATAAGGNWVTDEFESADYEAGNLETLWGMHLWDYESRPTIMPDGPPNEQQGEESEDFDDFYGSYRPRFIDTDDAREAVWATDEFESDEDNTESEWEPEYVGAGLGLQAEDPFNPQYSLRHSNHPLAPFPGEPLKWSSYVYDDGTTYEGLTRDAVPHGMGVMIFGNGTGGGFHFRDVRRGDKYEGEFQVGYAHGLGQFTSESKGEVYVGEFFAGQRHGCGIRINLSPYYYLLARGEDPVKAYQATHDSIMRNVEFRTWYRNKALGSDHEDEIIALGAVKDDFDNPAAVVLRNAQHEAKLRAWASMDTTDKALLKAVEIIEGVSKDRLKRRGGADRRAHFQVGEDGRLHEVLDSDNNDTDFDSVELMVGIESDGGPGLGWVGDDVDTDLVPYDSKLEEAILADVAEDKAEESEDKEGILGEDLVNPFTGLTLRDYLDGREGVYQELLQRTGYLDRMMRRPPPPPASFARKRQAAAGDAEGSTYVADWDPDAALQQQLDANLSRREQRRAAELLGTARALYGGDSVSRNPWSEDTDTRFETESDMMELCELAEILGTVDEAREIVTKARMWRWKPDGDVTFRFAQDANGAPLPLMQDPIHYPHGTKFMIPGPAGQVYPIPEDPAVRSEMVRAAKNYAHIYSLYNFDYDPEPGSVGAKIDGRIQRAHELELQSLGRMAEAAEALLAQEAAASKADAPAEGKSKSKKSKGKGKSGGSKGGSGGAPPAGPAAGGANPQAALAEAPENSAASTSTPGVSGGAAPFASMTMGYPAGAGWAMTGPFASVSLGMSRASKVVLHALSSAAKHAPSRRPRVMRPSHMRAVSNGARASQQPARAQQQQQ